MYRVFSSHFKRFASSQRIQFHRMNPRDSKKVVTPFMQVRTYLTKNFATLEPSRIQLSLSMDYIQCRETFFFMDIVLDRCQTLYIIILNLAKSYVFSKQSLFFIFKLPFPKRHKFFNKLELQVKNPTLNIKVADLAQNSTEYLKLPTEGIR